MAKHEVARIAFVGVGKHATESLYPNIAFIPEFKLVALVYRKNRRNAEYWADQYGITDIYTDVENMLDRVEPDGCCICGPPEMHHAVALKVLRRGIPIFVEKPLGMSLSAAQELNALAVEKHTWGQVGFMKRFAPANILAKRYIASSDFGSLSSLTLIHGCGPYEDEQMMLYFNGIHMIDLARFLGGEIAELSEYHFRGNRGNHYIHGMIG